MIEYIEKFGWIIGVLSLIGIEIAPVKISPFSWLGKIIGKLLGIDAIDKKVDSLKVEMDANEKDRIKYEILQFSGSLRQGLNRSETDYQHIETIFTKYRNKGGNSYIMHEMEYIRKCHDEGRIL